MHGHNPARPVERSDKIQVHEVWQTLQGEGPFSGVRAVFVRLSGCNLRCWFCDTTWDDEGDAYVEPGALLDTILAATKELGTTLVVVTGGEPARQPAFRPVVEALLVAGMTVQVETAGVLWVDWFGFDEVHLVVSPKTGRVHQNIVLREKNVYFKYVLDCEEGVDEHGIPSGNYQRARDGSHVGGALFAPPKGVPVYVTPMDHDSDRPRTIENHRLVGRIAMQHGYTAQAQIHKFMELP